MTALIKAVRKVYLFEGAAGASTEYWEQAWEGKRLSAALDDLGSDSGLIWRLLRDNVPPRARVLEAGCGSCLVVAYLERLGAEAIGVDLTMRALQAAKQEVPDLQLAAADVTRLPFLDESFDCIVSLGVVEHFEEGPLPALAEHRRVLKEGGVLLISVPRLSLLKRWNDLCYLGFRRRGSYVARGRIVTRISEPHATVGPWSFHQYEFPRRLFRAFLRRAGFEVSWIKPFLVNAGLGESAFVRRRGARRASGKTRTSEHSRKMGWLRQSILAERGPGILGAGLTRLAQEVVGHMNFARAYRIDRFPRR